MRYFSLLILFAFPALAFAFSDAEIISEINTAREANSLSKLSTNPDLSSAALTKAKSIAQLGNLVHTSSPFGVPWSVISDTGYVYGFAGENLAVSYEPETIVSGWLSSSSHRDNILNTSIVDVGVATVPVTETYLNDEGEVQSSVKTYVVAYFARPQELTPNARSVTYVSAPVASQVVSPSKTESKVEVPRVPDLINDGSSEYLRKELMQKLIILINQLIEALKSKQL
jgi:hypothetical protein